MRLPAIVNLDGYYLSFTREPVELPGPEQADRFLPGFGPEDIAFRASQPLSQAVVVLGGTPYSYFRYESHLAAQAAIEAHETVTAEFENLFGRRYGALEAYRLDDADYAFVMMGCFATKAKDAVDRLRESGWKIGLLRPRLLRPFPEAAIRAALAGKQAVAVIDQNLAMGKGGVLHTEFASALYGLKDAPPILASFVGGLGGRDIPPEEFFAIAEALRQAVETGATPPPRLLFSEHELREVRKLQAIAHVERKEAKS